MRRFIIVILGVLGFYSVAFSQDATVSDVWLKHNVYKSTGYYNQSVKGMEIHFSLEVDGLRQQKVGVAAFFAYHDGDEYVTLKTRSTTRYRAMGDNSVCTWEDFVLFIPYSELSKALPESASMACCVNVLHGSTQLAMSDMVEFEFNKN